MYNGIIIIDKPQEFTSHDVIAKLRGILKMRKIGHSGTLDPMATGILPVFLGNATRAVDFHMNTSKEYIATFKLGIDTDTQDIWGNILTEQEVSIDDTSVHNAILSFSGEILQKPPMYSAIRINGQRLYDIARQGKEVERPSRKINIFEIEILPHSIPNEYKIRILCSKGTYIRTLCYDIGQKLGTYATMTSLRRSKSGIYNQGFTLDEIQNLSDNNNIESILLKTDTVFSDYPSVIANETAFTRLCNGTFARDVDLTNIPDSNNILTKVYYNNKFFMLGKTNALYDGGRAVFPEKSFF